MDYSELSYKLTKNIDKKTKKINGIYFTPPNTINKILNLLKPFMKNINNILEPSCGSCEFISILDKKFKNLNIIGIEFNKKIYNSIKNLEKNNIKIHNDNFLSYEKMDKFDLIIGNPPYFVIKKKNVEPYYYNYFNGRPNIFILFVIKSLKLLSKNGILSFVLPKNFLNCLYYDKTRKFILEKFTILNLLECNDDYIETKQETIILLIQNKYDSEKINSKFVLKNSNYTIFGTLENIVELKKLYLNSTTLSKLKFVTSIGNIVWNQCKKYLTDNKNNTLLIYSSDIINNKLVIQKYKNKDKKNYIIKKGCTKPLLVINRGYGVGNYKFKYCLINDNLKYLIENHLICVNYSESKISNKNLIELYKKIIKSFENIKTKKFIDLYFGNNAINSTELNEIMPIYDI